MHRKRPVPPYQHVGRGEHETPVWLTIKLFASIHSMQAIIYNILVKIKNSLLSSTNSIHTVVYWHQHDVFVMSSGFDTGS